MGIRVGAFAKIWEVNEGKGNYKSARISIRKKVKGQYVNDYSGFVRFVGDAKNKIESVENIKGLSIQIKECDITNYYDKTTKKEYINPVIFDFDFVVPKLKEEENVCAKE